MTKASVWAMLVSCEASKIICSMSEQKQTQPSTKHGFFGFLTFEPFQHH